MIRSSSPKFQKDIFFLWLLQSVALKLVKSLAAKIWTSWRLMDFFGDRWRGSCASQGGSKWRLIKIVSLSLMKKVKYGKRWILLVCTSNFNLIQTIKLNSILCGFKSWSVPRGPLNVSCILNTNENNSYVCLLYGAARTCRQSVYICMPHASRQQKRQIKKKKSDWSPFHSPENLQS